MNAPPAVANATAWNPAPAANSAGVTALALGGAFVYIGGDFSNIGGQARRNLAAVDATSGALTAWNPGADFRVDRLLLVNNILYVSGPFRATGPYPRHSVAALDASTGKVTGWDAQVNTTKFVNDFATSNNLIHLGGSFFGVLNRPQRGIAAMSLSGNVAGPRIVHAVNGDANPTAAPFEVQRLTKNTPTPLLPFRVADDDTPGGQLVVTASSSNKELIPDANIVLGGSDNARTLRATPATNRDGIASITVTVSDGQFTAATSFAVLVQGRSSAEHATDNFHHRQSDDNPWSREGADRLHRGRCGNTERADARRRVVEQNIVARRGHHVRRVGS